MENIWTTPLLTIPALLILMLFPWIVAFGLYIKTHKGRLKDRFNLIWRKNRVVKVNFQTASGRNIERYIVPDKRGLLHISGGVYAYVHELATTNARFRIPEITIIESQIHPPTGDLTKLETEAEVSVPQTDGSVKKEKKMIPTYLLSFANKSPEKLNGHVAQEMKLALDSHIVEDVLTASDKTLRKIELMFILSCITLGAVVIIGIILGGMINGIQTDLEMMRHATP